MGLICTNLFTFIVALNSDYISANINISVYTQDLDLHGILNHKDVLLINCSDSDSDTDPKYLCTVNNHTYK